MLKYQLFIFFLISQTAYQSQPLQQQKWQSLFKYITFEQTLSAFPFLRQNFNPFKIADAFKPFICNVKLLPILILNNRIYFQGQYQNHQRGLAFQRIMNRIISKTVLPDMYFLLHIGDRMHVNQTPKLQHKLCRKLPMFMQNKNASEYFEQTKFLIPDYYVTQNWQKGIKGIKQCNLKYPQNKKDQRAFFRGLASSPYIIQHIPINKDTNFNRFYHRAAFVELSNQRPDLIYARLNNQSTWSMGLILNELQRRVGVQNSIAGKVQQNTYCQYRYLLIADGFGASWRRVLIALFSNSLMIKPRSEYFQWFYDKMIPGVHFVQVKKDLSDLIQTIEKLNKDKDLRIKIIKNANQLAEKYLTPQIITSYLVQQLKKYANVQKLTHILNQEEKKSLEMQLNRDHIEASDILKKIYRTNQKNIDKRLTNIYKSIEEKQKLAEKSKNISTDQALPQIKKQSTSSEINNKSFSQALPQIKKQSTSSEINNKSSSQALPQIKKQSTSSKINKKSSSQALPQIKKQSTSSEINNKSSSQALPQIKKQSTSSEIDKKSSSQSLPQNVNPIEYIALVVFFTFVLLFIYCCQENQKKQVPIQINQNNQEKTSILEIQQADSSQRRIMQKL